MKHLVGIRVLVVAVMVVVVVVVMVVVAVAVVAMAVAVVVVMVMVMGMRGVVDRAAGKQHHWLKIVRLLRFQLLFTFFHG